jgi:hypothetical protein
MSHELSELTSGLSSRVNNLAVLESGNDCRVLLEQQDRLAKLTMAAIVKNLNEEQASYKEALIGLNDAIKYIGEADKKIDNVAKAIKLTAKAIGLVDKALVAATVI